MPNPIINSHQPWSGSPFKERCGNGYIMLLVRVTSKGIASLCFSEYRDNDVFSAYNNYYIQTIILSHAACVAKNVRVTLSVAFNIRVSMPGNHTHQ